MSGQIIISPKLRCFGHVEDTSLDQPGGSVLIICPTFVKSSSFQCKKHTTQHRHQLNNYFVLRTNLETKSRKTHTHRVEALILVESRYLNKLHRYPHTVLRSCCTLIKCFDRQSWSKLSIFHRPHVSNHNCVFFGGSATLGIQSHSRMIGCAIPISATYLGSIAILRKWLHLSYHP